MTVTLRPYQTAALEAVARREHARGIVALPTGTGKTVVGAHFPAVLGDVPVLYLAHREELIEQLWRTVGRVTGAVVGVERAHERASPMARHVVASVPTLAAREGRRLEALGTDRFGAVVVDEAHHGTAESYLRTWRHFGMLDEGNVKLSGGVPLIGLTATPGRGDGVGLHVVFDGITYQYSLRQAIADGWLVPIHAYTVRTETSLDGVKTRHGDFAEGELAAAVATDARNAMIFDAHQREARGLKTLVFCVDVAHAEQVAQHFNARGVEAMSVSGRDATEDRRNAFAWFHATPGAVLTNCQIVTEGVDIPSVECVVLGRPTRSATLMAQMIGRGTRLAAGCYDYAASVLAGKSRVLVLDITDRLSDVGKRAVNVMDLTGAPLPTKALSGQDIFEEAEEQERQLEAHRQAREARTRSVAVDLFAEAEPAPPECRMDWLVLGAELRLSVPSYGTVRVQSDVLDRWTVDRFDRERREWRPVVEPQDARADAVRAAEGAIREALPYADKILSRDAKWKGDEPSEKQIATYRKVAKAEPPPGMTKGQMSLALDRLFARRA